MYCLHVRHQDGHNYEHNHHHHQRHLEMKDLLYSTRFDWVHFTHRIHRYCICEQELILDLHTKYHVNDPLYFVDTVVR